MLNTSGQTVFRPRARLIRLLGEELISDEATAVSELVKNAYDADATNVNLRLVHGSQPSVGWIEIRDDGCGMSLDTLLNAWLEPATSFKRRGGRKQRTERGRYPLGEKGVGRFAADKLGAELELISRAFGAEDEVKLVVSWEQFVDGQYLDEIRNDWSVTPPEEFAGTHGTVLRIRCLRTVWDRALVGRVQEGLGRLISPTASNSNFSVALEVSDFPDLSGPIRNHLLDSAPYRLTGVVTREGSLVRTDHEAIDLREIAGEQFQTHRGRRLRRPVCGPFSISLSVWDLDVLGSREARLSRTLRAVLRQTSGVSIYRDGFRIAPYGDRGDDWLQLNQRRVNNPTMRVSTNQIVGVIEITQEDNTDLRDRTSREGLIDTLAFRDLRALVLAAVSVLEEDRYSRRKASAAAPAPEGSDPVLVLLDRVGLHGVPTSGVKAAVDAYRHYKQEVERREQILLRVASSGAAAETLIGQLNGSVAALLRMLPMLRSQVGESPALDRVSERISLVAKQLDALERLQSGRQQNGHVDLRSVAQDAAAVYAPLLKTAAVELHLAGPSGVIVQADRSFVLQALLHVLENSILAAAKMSRYRWVEIEINAVPSQIIVRDSGPGVSYGRRELIFDPFFTTREGADGLGLFFARTLVRSAGHDLVVSGEGDQFCFTFAESPPVPVGQKPRSNTDQPAANVTAKDPVSPQVQCRPIR